MKRLITLLAITVASSAIPATGVTAEPGRTPSYLILRAPARVHRGPAYYPGRGYEVRPQSYSYGWFGVRPRRHLRRSTGYFENYIQWTKQ